MSFTRKFDDEETVKTKLHQLSAPSCYILQPPGPGVRPHFVEDPHIRLQKWGANLRSNCCNLSANMRGLGIPLTRDCTDKLKTTVSGQQIAYPTASAWTDETRATHPVWWYRTVTRSRNDYLPIDPQFNAESRRWVSRSTRDEARTSFEKDGVCSSGDK